MRNQTANRLRARKNNTFGAHGLDRVYPVLMREHMTSPASATITDTNHVTQHAMLLAWGHFARTTGLLEAMLRVQIAQKVVPSALLPTQKLTEWLIGLLAGIAYLRDLSEGAAPLARDTEVAHAWQLDHLGSASAVSRTLQACTDDTVRALQTVLDEVSQPFLAQAIRDLRMRGQVLELDADLTGRPVSATSRTFPGAAFGHMDGEIRLGYQLAAVCLHTETYGRQWLCGQHHPGNTVAAPCLHDLVVEAERRLGCHPRRRVDLVEQRVQALDAQVAEMQRLVERQTCQIAQQQVRQTSLAEQIAQAQRQADDWRAQPLSKRQNGAFSRLSRLQQQMLGWQRQQTRAVATLQRAQAAMGRHQACIDLVRTQRQQLQLRVEQLCQENQSQPDAPRCLMRVDAGFCCGENLAMLLELGYDVDTKSGNEALVRTLRQQVTADMPWTRVGDNAEMIGWPTYTLTTCPYRVAVGLECFHTGQNVRYAALIRYRPDPPTSLSATDLIDWFHAYNARQTIEAGNKEAKTVFHIQHLMTHSPAAIQMQAMLTLFAANFVRWAADWLRPRVQDTTPRFEAALRSPKHLVRVAANSPATVVYSGRDISLHFGALSSFSGIAIRLSQPTTPLQLPLPLFKSDLFCSPKAICPVVAQQLG
jgi:hypothetical protein